MSLLHGHDHHHHHHEHDDGAARPVWILRNARLFIAAVLIAAATVSACISLVRPGEALVVTRFGNPVRIVTEPGIVWRLPAPFENTISVDLRLLTTSSGLQDVGTRDGLRVLVQAYVAWQVPNNPKDVTQFLRAVRNQPDEAGQQLRSYIASSLETTASGFELASLVNTDPHKVDIERFEQRLRVRLEQQVLSLYGIAIRQVGLERLTLPPEALSATVARMRAERQTVAAERVAQGERVAAEIRSNADRDARVMVAKARADAAETEARARSDAADIYQRAYASNPTLYSLLRSLDTLDAIVGDNTRLVLRTDAAPFRAFVEGPRPLPSSPSPPAPPSSDAPQ